MAAPRHTRGKSIAKIDSDWINIETLQSWLRHCDKHHGLECKQLISGSTVPDLKGLPSRAKSYTQKFRLPSPRFLKSTSTQRMTQTDSVHDSTRGRPQWLIDVEKACLLPAGPQDQYAALSYVWGQVPMFKTVRQNLAQLQVDGAIRDLGDMIPKTIQHAIELTRRLEIRFIWIDCLCIVQDDDKNLYSQLQDMASIFAAAYVTLVAANGWDANHGLRGIKGVSDPRQLSGDFDLYESLQPHSSIWYSRGWTFQEMVFSRRTIMLQYQLAIWGCRSASWHEGTLHLRAPSEDLQDLHISKWKGKGIVPYPDPEAYINLVREYNNRTLTFQSDVYPAITGLLSIWSQYFDGGFLSGLPRMFFESALLWQPYDPLQRRVQRSPQSPQYNTPSWSWLGWQGELNSKEWSTKWDFIRPFSEYHTFEPKVQSIHQWFYGNDVNKMMPVNTSSPKNVTYGAAISKDLPRGWRKKKITKGTIRHIAYIHERFPDVPLPYPITLPKEGLRTAVEPSVKFVSCYTRRGFLKGKRNPFPVSDDGACTDVWLNVIEDKIIMPPVGFIRMHDTEIPKLEQQYELVALSSSVMFGSNKGLATKYLERFMSPSEKFTLCNVMWIEWHDGIAYRKGVGQVYQDVWEGLELEWIDLVLG